MLKKILSIAFVLTMFLTCSIFVVPHDKSFKVVDVISPTKIVIDETLFELNDLDCFDSKFTAHNKELAKRLNITETEAFLLGNLGKYKFENLLKGQNVLVKNDDLIYYRYGYRDKFFYSGFCIKDFEPCSKDAF